MPPVRVEVFQHLSTQLTGMGLDIGVSIQVLLQLVSKQETLAANFTNLQKYQTHQFVIQFAHSKVVSYLIFGSIFMLSLLVSRDPFD